MNEPTVDLQASKQESNNNINIKMKVNKHTKFSFVVTQLGTRSFPSGLVPCICTLKNSISPGTKVDVTCPP